MDNSQPLDIVLHLDYIPYDPRDERGWDTGAVLDWIKDVVIKAINPVDDSLALVDIEIVPVLKP